MFKTVLFPIDQSREAREAVEPVLNIVQQYKSKLILLSVVETEATGEKPAQPGVMNSPEAVAKLLQEAQAFFVSQGIQSEMIERSGMPAFTICDVADEVNAELIVMGCRGLGLTDEGLHESVTYRVVNLSPCPVLVIP